MLEKILGSVRTVLSQQPLTEQAWASNLCWRRPKAVTSTGVGSRELPLREQAWTRDLCGLGPSQGLCGSRPKPETSAETGLSQWPSLEQACGSDLQKHGVTSRVTGTMAWLHHKEHTIWALDLLAPGRFITRDTVLTTPIRGKDG